MTNTDQTQGKENSSAEGGHFVDDVLAVICVIIVLFCKRFWLLLRLLVHYESV